MDFILITFNYGKSNSVDMKIPAFMPAGEFIDIMCQIFGVSGDALQAEPLGIVLDGQLSFADQQVEHGAVLTLHS